MSETKTVWHPYPKEKPKRDKEYLVTCVHQDGNKFIFIDFWFSATGEGEWFTAPEKVIAWAELPEPYRPEVNNGRAD